MTEADNEFQPGVSPGVSPDVEPFVELDGQVVSPEVSRLGLMTDFLMAKTVSVKNVAIDVKDTVLAAVGDVRQRPGPAFASSAFFGVTQYYDRIREPFVRLSDVSTEHLAKGSLKFIEGLQNSTEAGLAAGGILAASYFVIGHGVSEAVRAFPDTSRTFVEKFPRLYKVSKHSTAGVIERTSQSDDIKERSSVSRAEVSVKEKILATLELAGQGLGIGTAAQGAISSLEGWDRKETTRLIAKTSLAMGAAVVPMVVGLDAVVDYLARNGHYDWAERTVDWVTDRKLWLGIALAGAVANYKRNTSIANEAAS